MSSNDFPTENTIAVEDSLKELLDKMLDYFQKYIKTDQDLQQLEEKLHDYDSLQSLVKIINDVFVSLTEKIDKLTTKDSNENYDELEKIVQKHEGEIRNHIQIEQQLKLYAESLQSKVEDSEKARGDLLDQTKGMINDIKRDNQKLAESCKKLKEENRTLTQKLKDFEGMKKQYEDKLTSHSHLQERVSVLEKISRQSENSFYNKEEPLTNRTSVASGGGQVDPEMSRPNSKSSVSVGRKVMKSAYNISRQPQPSPLKTSNRNPVPQDNRNSDYLKVKVDLGENEHIKDLEALKRSCQLRRSSNPRERTNSISKTRDLKSMHSQSIVGHNSSNSSIVYLNKNPTTKPAKEVLSTSLHKKSKSSCISPKTKASLNKKEFEKLLLYANLKGKDSTPEPIKSKYK